MKRRQLLLGSNAVLSTILFFGAILFLYQIAEKYRWQLDISQESRHSLSLDMRQILSIIEEEEPIRITAFTSQEGRRDSMEKNRFVRDLLQQLERNCTNIEWEQIDFDRDRVTAEQLGVSEYGRIVVQQGKERVDIKERLLFQSNGSSGLRFYGEEELYRAFSTLVHNERRTIYFSTGR